MNSMIHSGVANLSLPDRAIQIAEFGAICDSAENAEPSFAGGFSREEVRALAARELGISSKALHHLVHEDVQGVVDLSVLVGCPGRERIKALLENIARSNLSEFVINFACNFVDSHTIERLSFTLEAFDALGGYGVPLADHFLNVILHELQQVSLETARFEINLAASEGFISSSSSVEETVANYSILLMDREYLDYVLAKYPMLPVHLSRRLNLVTDAVKSFGKHLQSDMLDLRRVAGISENDQIDRIVTTLGDSHLGGARVVIVQFMSGLRVVYKPRSVQGEAAFQAYLGWANETSDLPKHGAIWVLDRNEYGWMEFVQPKEAMTDQDINEYFFRYGSLIALLHSVAGTDIHYENLVACRNQPIVVDLETIMQPLAYNTRGEEGRKFILNLDYFADTPIYTAMFDPAFLSKSLTGAPLNSVQDDSEAKATLSLNNDGTIVVVRDYSEAKIGPNVLRRDGVAVSFLDYVDVIVRGYRDRMMGLILKRAELINNVLPDLFGSIVVRVIFRYTAHYGSYVSGLYSPYCMESLRNTEEVLSELWSFGLSTSAGATLISAEYRDIWNGDIPYFSARVDSCDAIDSHKRVHSEVLELAGLDAVRSRLLKSSIALVQEEVEILEYCLRHSWADHAANIQSSAHDRVKSWRELYREIAERIIVRGDRVLYMEPIMDRDLSISQGIISNDFGSGLAGVVYSLAYCSHFDEGRPHHEKIRALADMVFLRDDVKAYEVGMCVGLGGLVYLAAHLGVLWSDPYYFRVGEHLAARIGRTCWFDRHLDVYSGTAGAILAVDALIEATGSDTLLPLLSRLVQHLLEQAIVTAETASWPSSIPSRGPTTGFAHGVSGIGYALTRAYRRLRGDELESLIRGAERFIHGCFDPERGTWAEDAGGSASSMDVWCHGAPGIAIFYDELAQVFADDVFAQRRAESQKSVVRFASFENDSICHGTLGNVDLLLTLKRRADPRLIEVGGDTTLEDVAAELTQRPLVCGNDRRHDSLSLFTGFAGGIYQLLRLERNGSLPSVSAFHGPLLHGY